MAFVFQQCELNSPLLQLPFWSWTCILLPQLLYIKYFIWLLFARTSYHNKYDIIYCASEAKCLRRMQVIFVVQLCFNTCDASGFQLLDKSCCIVQPEKTWTTKSCIQNCCWREIWDIKPHFQCICLEVPDRKPQLEGYEVDIFTFICLVPLCL